MPFQLRAYNEIDDGLVSPFPRLYFSFYLSFMCIYSFLHQAHQLLEYVVCLRTYTFPIRVRNDTFETMTLAIWGFTTYQYFGLGKQSFYVLYS